MFRFRIRKPASRRPAAIRLRDPGSGVPAFNVKESAVGPVPQVHTYVPGVRPSELKVALLKVSDPESGTPEVYPWGTPIWCPKPKMAIRLPLPEVAVFDPPAPKDEGPDIPAYSSPVTPANPTDAIPNCGKRTKGFPNGPSLLKAARLIVPEVLTTTFEPTCVMFMMTEPSARWVNAAVIISAPAKPDARSKVQILIGYILLLM
jgi:hypothetical protein